MSKTFKQVHIADDTAVVGLLTDDDDEKAYREGIRHLALMCRYHNFPQCQQDEELIAEYRRRRAEHTPIHIEGAVVERVESFKFFGVHITKET
jgi:hypothetical protein